MSQLEACGHGQEGFKSCKEEVHSHDTVKYHITVTLRGPWGLGQHCPHVLRPVRRWLVKWHKKTQSGNHWPCFKGRKQRVFALPSLGTKVFLFRRRSQSLESWGKKHSAPSGRSLRITAGPSFKWWVLARLGRMQGPTAALGCWKRARTGWGYKAEAPSSTGSVCPGDGKNIQSSSDPRSPSRRTEHPDVKKTIYRSISSCQYLSDIDLSGWQV